MEEIEEERGRFLLWLGSAVAVAVDDIVHWQLVDEANAWGVWKSRG